MFTKTMTTAQTSGRGAASLRGAGGGALPATGAAGFGCGGGVEEDAVNNSKRNVTPKMCLVVSRHYYIIEKTPGKIPERAVVLFFLGLDDEGRG